MFPVCSSIKYTIFLREELGISSGSGKEIGEEARSACLRLGLSEK